MDVGVPQEIGDMRVVATPKTVAQSRKLGYHVFVELGTDLGAPFSDDAYREVGGVIVDNAQDRDTVLAVGAPSDTQLLDMHPGATLIPLLAPRQDPSLTRRIIAQGANAFNMDMVSCISRAQALDVLNSLANIPGYRAATEVAHISGRFFTGQATAAGRVSLATVFVIDTDMAGLAAIDAASSLGAVVRATDVRLEIVEQVISMGATFLYVGQADQGVGSDGYAKEVDADYAAHAVESHTTQVREVDIIITTAAVPGKPPPRLITAEMVEFMKPGPVVVDMAAIGGGNCEFIWPGESYVTESGVTIIGYIDLSSRLPGQSSQLYGTNLINTLKFMAPGKDGNLVIDFDDEVVCNTTTVRSGEVTFSSPETKVSAAPASATMVGLSTSTTPAKPPRPW